MCAQNSVIIIFALALLLTGCTQTTYIGYLEKDYPVGSQMQEKLQLISKEECLFGASPFIVKSEDASICSGLEKGQYYLVQGKVSSYMSATSGMTLLVETVETAFHKDGEKTNIRISVPVVKLKAPRRLDYKEVLFKSIVWEEDVGQLVQMACSNKSEESEMEVVVDGKYESTSVWHPVSDDFGMNATVGKAIFGYYDLEFRNGSTRREWGMMLEISGIPGESLLFSDIIALTGGAWHNCAKLSDAGAVSYYFCDAYDGLEYADFKRIDITYHGEGDVVCNGADDIRH